MTFLTLQDIGQRVRAVRKARGMRQADLAEAAQVSRYTVIKLERGQLVDINVKTLSAILLSLGLELRVVQTPPSGLPILGESRDDAFGEPR